MFLPRQEEFSVFGIWEIGIGGVIFWDLGQYVLQEMSMSVLDLSMLLPEALFLRCR